MQAIVQDESVWLTQKGMAQLFGVEVNTINYHLKDIYQTKELEESRTIRKIRIVQQEGKRQVEREDFSVLCSQDLQKLMLSEATN